MTLLLTAMNTAAIHQSSDYRLTDLSTGKPVEDSAGAKQVSFGGMDFAAQISFTGVASVGGVGIRDLISKVVAPVTRASELQAVVGSLATAGTDAIKNVALDKRFVTILLAVTQGGKLPRVFLISNADRPDAARLQSPLGVLEVHEVVALSPRALICGLTAAVSLADRKLLRQLSRSSQSSGQIRNVLAEINKRAAGSSKGGISAECMVSSLLADGTRSSQNIGLVAGIPDAFVGSTNIAEFIKGHFRPAPGKKITLVQTAGRFTGQLGRPAPVPSEVGEPRTVVFSAPSTTTNFSIDNAPGPSVSLNGLSGTVMVQKNLWATSTLNTVTFQIDPARRYSKLPISIEWVQLPNLPMVDGAQPHTWNYLLNLKIDESRKHTLSVSQNSMAFRSVNCPAPLPVLAPNEELVMVAPPEMLVLTASPEAPMATGRIQARFLLRDLPELNSPPEIRFPGGKVGRNAPCPCGSGRKHKRCCGKPS